MIHTYGDSHSLFGWKDVKTTKVSINNIGPRLMYSFGASSDIIVNPNCINEGDSIIFCFGEIDCRCHIHKFINENTSNIEEVIEGIVYPYIKTIIKNMNLYSNKKVKTFIYSIPPPIKKEEGIENGAYPFLGSDEERKEYHQKMNEILNKRCLENNIIFFDIYDDYSNDGYLIKELSDGICHVSNPIHIEKKIKHYNI